MADLLSSRTLSDVKPYIKTFNYDIDKLTTGIVHIGIGAFHRAHQAVFTDDLLALDPSWKITAVSLRSADIQRQMQPQDYLYSVVERLNNVENARVIGAIDRVIVAPEYPQDVIQALASPHTKVVTITITEKGYCRDFSGQHLDIKNEGIKHDLLNPQSPQTFVGFFIEAFRKRQQLGEKLTVISCDNLPSNGKITRNIVMEYAEIVDSGLAKWIDSNINFCSSMVDRIVPARTQLDIDRSVNVLGMEDRCIIVTEPFKQWVIEDNFAAEKPAWNQVGALFAKDIEPFEDMKLRLLNGAHSALAYVGFLMGYEYIHQAIRDDGCLKLIKLLHKDLQTTLEDVPDIDFKEYSKTIIQRFSNEGVPYKTSQVASDGSQKLPQRLIKPLSIILSRQGYVSNSIAFVIASWCYYLKGVKEDGEAYTITDPMGEKLVDRANRKFKNYSEFIADILSFSGVCNSELLARQDFINKVSRYCEMIDKRGIKAEITSLTTVSVS